MITQLVDDSESVWQAFKHDAASSDDAISGVAGLAMEMAKGVALVHRNNVLHRDVQPRSFAVEKVLATSDDYSIRLRRREDGERSSCATAPNMTKRT